MEYTRNDDVSQTQEGGAVDKGVATHFFILRQGLKEYGRIVKSAASELLSPVSSFFLFYFLQPEFRYVAAALGEFGFRATLPKCTNLGV